MMIDELDTEKSDFETLEAVTARILREMERRLSCPEHGADRGEAQAREGETLEMQAQNLMESTS